MEYIITNECYNQQFFSLIQNAYNERRDVCTYYICMYVFLRINILDIK